MLLALCCIFHSIYHKINAAYKHHHMLYGIDFQRFVYEFSLMLRLLREIIFYLKFCSHQYFQSKTFGGFIYQNKNVHHVVIYEWWINNVKPTESFLFPQRSMNVLRTLLCYTTVVRNGTGCEGVYVCTLYQCRELIFNIKK